MSRGLSRDRRIAAALSSLGAGLGIMAHSTAATLGLALVLHASPWLSWWSKQRVPMLSASAFTSRRLRRAKPFVPAEHHTRSSSPALLSNLLNPKPGLFVVTFIPQFVSASRELSRPKC